MKTLRILAVSGNAGWLLFMLVMLLLEPHPEPQLVIATILVVVTALSAIIVMVTTALPKTWLGLWLQRKRLEEQSKIDALSARRPSH